MGNLLSVVLLLFVISLSLGQLGRLPFGGITENIYLNDILLVGLIVAWGIWVARNWKRVKKLPVPPIIILGGLFVLWSLITLVMSYSTFGSAIFTQGLFYWVRWCLYFCLFIIVYTLNSRSFQKTGVWPLGLLSFVLCSLSLAIFGFFQLVFFPDFTLMAISGGWDPHKNRLFSTFFDPNFTGAFLGMGLLLILPQMLLSYKTKVDAFFEWGTRKSPLRYQFRPGLVGIAIILGIALFLTFSRSAWGMVAIGITVIGVFKYRWLLVIGVILALSAYFFVPRVQTRLVGITDPADSAAYRLVSWRKTLEVYKDYPWWGTGFGNFRLAQKEAGYFGAGDWGGRSGAGSDSSLFLVLATTGPIGLILYLCMYGYMGYTSWQVFRRSKNSQRQALALSLLAIFAGLLLESNFVNSLFYPPIMAFVWLLYGIVCDTISYT